MIHDFGVSPWRIWFALYGRRANESCNLFFLLIKLATESYIFWENFDIDAYVNNRWVITSPMQQPNVTSYHISSAFSARHSTHVTKFFTDEWESVDREVFLFSYKTNFDIRQEQQSVSLLFNFRLEVAMERLNFMCSAESMSRAAKNERERESEKSWVEFLCWKCVLRFNRVQLRARSLALLDCSMPMLLLSPFPPHPRSPSKTSSSSVCTYYKQRARQWERETENEAAARKKRILLVGFASARNYLHMMVRIRMFFASLARVFFATYTYERRYNIHIVSVVSVRFSFQQQRTLSHTQKARKALFVPKKITRKINVSLADDMVLVRASPEPRAYLL